MTNTKRASDHTPENERGGGSGAPSSLEEESRTKLPSLERRIFLMLSVVSTVLAVLVLVISTLVYQANVVADTGKSLEDECRIVASILADGNTDYGRLSSIDVGEARITLVAEDGTVLYDNKNNYQIMPSHNDRPEIQEAERDGVGSSERESETAGTVGIYRAVRASTGVIVRMSLERENAVGALFHDMGLVLGVAAGFVVLSWVVSRLVAARLMRPVVRINPSSPDPDSSYRELRPMLSRISEQQRVLSEQVEELKGNDLMRREFTANVTHELKTPLTTISGAAELIRDGIARPDDVPEFAGRIYDEAAHMTELVNDILTLSKLDESERSRDKALVGHMEPVDLHHVVEDVCRRLTPTAEGADVTITASGTSVLIRGVAHLLDELVYNLCDNAIRYNREGGSVSAWAGILEGHPVVRVSDTGVGIPVEAQTKVFERFYRVDSSRARTTGGTGLGLAIVKHAASYHGAQLTLTSEEGRGTTIVVTFPTSCLVREGELG